MDRSDFARLKYVGLSSRRNEGKIHLTMVNRITGETSHGESEDWESAYVQAMGDMIHKIEAHEAKAS